MGISTSELDAYVHASPASDRQGATRHVAGTVRCSWGAARHSKIHQYIHHEPASTCSSTLSHVTLGGSPPSSSGRVLKTMLILASEAILA